jgi:hypothetical protein
MITLEGALQKWLCEIGKASLYQAETEGIHFIEKCLYKERFGY